MNEDGDVNKVPDPDSADWQYPAFMLPHHDDAWSPLGTCDFDHPERPEFTDGFICGAWNGWLGFQPAAVSHDPAWSDQAICDWCEGYAYGFRWGNTKRAAAAPRWPAS